MKVLITGGTGFVGKHLRDHVRKQGHEVRLLVRSGSEYKVTPADAYEIVSGDIFDTNACLRACDGADAIIHLVGIIREFPAHGITFDQFHPVVTANMLNGARRCGIERFVHMSALGSRDDAPSAYHRSKYASEQLVRESTCRWTIVRPSLIFGQGDHLMPEFLDLVRKPRIPLIAGGQTLFRPVAIQDVCTAMAGSLSMPETQGQAYDLGGACEITMREILEEIAKLSGAGGKFMNLPSWAIRPVVSALQRYPWFPLTRDQMVMLSEANTCEIDRFVKTFNVEPKSFRDALPSLVAEAERSEVRFEAAPAGSV
jgi:NADH dehydrogenase